MKAYVSCYKPHSDNINMIKKISEVYVRSSYSYNSHRFQTEKGSCILVRTPFLEGDK